MSKSLGGKINDVAGKVVHAVGTQNSGKSFGELFEEKKSQLDNLQSSLSSAIFPSFPGQPAGKFTDVGIGIDFHSTVLPPSPMMPVPNVMMVFDIIGAISGCIPPIPPPSEGESESIGALVVRTIVTMMQPSVKVNNQWIANAGTSIQHLPGVFVHGPSPTVAPMAEGEMFMGSSTVLADGSPFSYQYLPSLSCNMVGIPAPFRAKKPNAKPKLSLMAPTISLVNVVPKGLPVLVGGPPTIDLFGMAVNLGLKGFGKLWKFDASKVSNIIEQIKKKAKEIKISKNKILKTNSPFNELGKLKPNIKYISGEYSYIMETDHLGRIHKASTDNLQLTKRTKRLKHNPNTPGKLKGDHAGHIFGDRFGGSPELDNLVSQAQTVNLSEYKKIENKWAKALEPPPKDVTVDIKINYKANSMRPSSFEVNYTIDGEHFSQIIKQ